MLWLLGTKAKWLPLKKGSSGYDCIKADKVAIRLLGN